MTSSKKVLSILEKMLDLNESETTELIEAVSALSQNNKRIHGADEIRAKNRFDALNVLIEETKRHADIKR